MNEMINIWQPNEGEEREQKEGGREAGIQEHPNV